MFYKVILWVVLLFIGYNVFLTQYPLQNVGYYTVQEKAEEFVFNDTYYDTILVGSSLVGAFGHINVFQGKKFLNLFLVGNSAVTGVELIVKSGNIPKVLFVETHHLTMGLNKTFIRSVFQGYEIKQFFPALQSKNKLLPVIFKKLKPTRVLPTRKNQFYQQFFDQIMVQKIKEYSSVEDSSVYIQHVKHLEEKLQYLQANGCKVYLFEIPVEKELAVSKRAVFLRQKNMQILNSKNYHWIPYDRWRTYRTNDGIHLLKNQSYAYEKFLERYFLWLENRKLP